MAKSDSVEALNQLLTSSDEDDKKKKKKKGEVGGGSEATFSLFDGQKIRTHTFPHLSKIVP